jgi:hypothetical protein
MLLESLDFRVGPGADFLSFGSLDAKRGIMVKPSDADRVSGLASHVSRG